MTELTFTETSVPKLTKDAAPNPFLEPAKKLADNRELALTFTPAYSSKDAEVRAKELSSLLSKWRAAGEAHGVTIRKKVDGDAVTVWAVDRIVRNRSESESDAAE